jgi:SSS family solute:Na+ symporter
MFIKLALTLLFLAVMVGVGVYSRRHSGSVDGFVLGGRNVGPWLTAFAYGTSYFSAVVFIGYAGQFGWKYGLSSSWIGVGNAVIGSLLAWLVLGRRTMQMTRKLQSRTMPDFFGSRFDSEALRVAASVIAFVFLIPYTAGVYKGISTLFEMSMHIRYEYCVVLMAVLTALYVILGGYKATAINDFIQGIVMLFGITAVIIAVLSLKGGLVEAVHKLAEVPSDANPAVNGGFASLFGPDPRGLLGVVILTSLGTWGLPQMVGKFYSITDESAIRRGTVISTVFAFVVAGGCYFLGGFGRLFPVPAKLPNGHLAFDSIIPSMLVTLPDILIALVVLLVLSASMSTLASLVLTSSSTLTLDIIYRDKASAAGEVEAGQLDDSVAEKIERRKVVVMRVLILFFIALSLMIALNPPTFIAQLMGISWGALAGAFLAPFMLGLYWRGVTRAAVWACFAWGVGLTVINMLAGNPINPIDCGALAMLGGFVVVPVVSLLSPRLPAAFVKGMFALAVLCLAPVAAFADEPFEFNFGGDMRVRQEIMDNVPGMPGIPGENAGGVLLHRKARPYTNQVRFRPRVWGELKAAEHWRLYLRLADEFRWNVRPHNHTSTFPDELVIDNLFVEATDLFDGFLDLKIGRQDLYNLYGLDHVFVDGTPGDGSRTVYSDVARFALKFEEDRKLDLFFLHNWDENPLRWGTCRSRRSLSGLGGVTNKGMDDWGWGAVWSGKAADWLPYQVFAMQKITESFRRGGTYHSYTRREMLGVKLTPQLTDEFSLQLEAMGQVGRNGDGAWLSGWSTYSGVNWKSSAEGGPRPFASLGFHTMSGDRNAAAEDGGHDAWDPMWSRGVNDSELMLYGTHYGMAWWSNMMYLKLTLGIDIAPRHRIAYVTGPMFAAVRDGMGGAHGGFKGYQNQIRYDFPLWKLNAEGRSLEMFGHVVAELFNPGDYFETDKPGWFVRWQLDFTF